MFIVWNSRIQKDRPCPIAGQKNFSVKPKTIGGQMAEKARKRDARIGPGHGRLTIIPGAPDFRELFEAHYAGVFRWTSYLLADPAAAEDVTQEAFMKLLYSPPAEQTNISAWLNKVAANLAFNYLRSEKSRRERETKSGALTPNTADSAEDHTVEIEGLAEAKRTLGRLESRDRLCLLLRAAGYSYEEIGEAIGVKKSSVGTILVRAQAKFMEIYGNKKEV